MNQSSIENVKPEPQPNSEQKADNKQASQSIANAHVISSQYSVGRLENVKLVKHESIKSILSSHYDEPEETVFELQISGESFNGNIIEMQVAEQAALIKQNGFWGFASVEENEINYWIGEENKKEDLIFFVAHELGHLVGSCDSNDMEEEFRADSYAHVAIKTFELAKSLGC